MIIRKDDQWTIIECQDCKLCHKVLNGKHMKTLQCPYCGHTIGLSEGTVPLIKPRAKKSSLLMDDIARVAAEEAQKPVPAASKEDAGTLLWKES